MPEPTALLVSRSPAVIESIQGARDRLGHLRLTISPNLDDASIRIQRERVALVLAHLPAVGDDAGALRLLWGVAATRRPCATLMLADTYHEHQAASLLRAGAADYLELPLDLGKLANLVDVLTHSLRRFKGDGLAAPATPDAGADEEGLADLMVPLRRVAPQDTTLLLTGETGSGKTRLARRIHEMSPRRKEPFLVVDCGSLVPTLVESELFGHVKGAFTGADRDRTGKFAAVGSGTLFLDEINSLPRELQAKLLRAVDERVFEPVGANQPQQLRARLIAASNTDLEKEVAAGRFRADLYHRLNVVGFYLPPLRERRAGVVPLARQFLQEFAGRNRPDVTGISGPALRALQGSHWPGNVRELRNTIERAVALCEGPEVLLEDLPNAMKTTNAPILHAAGPPPGVAEASSTLAQSKQQIEMQRIQEALQRHRNNRLRAAAELGISRMGLYKKLHQYGMAERPVLQAPVASGKLQRPVSSHKRLACGLGQDQPTSGTLVATK